MSFIARGGKVIEAKETRAKVREPKKLPSVGEKESVREYICALTKDSPVLSLTLLGINFDKRVLSPDHSLVENMQTPQEYGVVSRTLTDNQVSALRERAKEKIVEWREKGTRKLCRVPAAKLLFITPIEEYNPVSTEFYSPPKESEIVEEEETGDIKEEIYKQQRKKRKGE